MDNFYFGQMGGWGMGGYLGMFVFWIIGILFLVWLIKELFSGKENGTINSIENATEKSPMDILKERYAKGEITKKEYEEKKKEFLV